MKSESESLRYMECAITCQFFFLDIFMHVFGAHEKFLKEPDCEMDQSHELSHLEEVSHFLKHSSCEEEHKPTTTTTTKQPTAKQKRKRKLELLLELLLSKLRKEIHRKQSLAESS